MQLAWSPEDEAFRAELIGFLDAHTPAQMSGGYDFQDVGDADELVPQWLRDWQATLFDHGWMIPGYPPELGGRNCTPVQTLIYLETLAVGDAAQRPLPRVRDRRAEPARVRQRRAEQLVPAAIRGDTIWCIGMSEPNAGSDLAGLQTCAEVHDDHFVVNGQKVWTSYAMIAQNASATSAPIRRCRSTRASRCSSSTSTRPASTSGPCATSTARRVSRKCSSPTSSSRARTSSVGSTAVGRSRRDHSRTSAAACGSKASAWFEQTIDGLIKLVLRTGPGRRPDHPAQDRDGVRARGVVACPRLQGLLVASCRARAAPEHSYMKMATSEAGKAAYELGMEISGPLAPVTDPELGATTSRLVARLLHVVRRTRSRAAARRSSATSSPSACSGLPRH